MIETERLIITEFKMDMAEIVQINSVDEDNKKYLPDEVWESVEEVKEILTFLIKQYDSFSGPFVYPIIIKATNQNIGYVQLVPMKDGKWEIGYHIAKKYTGQGYAQEALKAFLPVITKKIGIKEVYGICLKENIASNKVLQKCGFLDIFNGTGNYQNENREIIKYIYKIN